MAQGVSAENKSLNLSLGSTSSKMDRLRALIDAVPEHVDMCSSTEGQEVALNGNTMSVEQENKMLQEENNGLHKQNNELREKLKEAYSVMETFSKANDDLQLVESDLSIIYTMTDDLVFNIKAVCERKLNIERKQKNKEILSLREALQKANSKSLQNKTQLNNSLVNGSVESSQLNIEWEKLTTELKKKDEEILSLKVNLYESNSVLQRLESQQGVTNTINEDVVSQIKTEWERKLYIELGEKNKEILSLKEALQKANSELLHVESELCMINTINEDVVSQMKAECEKKLNSDLGEKNKEILSLKKALQKANNELCEKNGDLFLCMHDFTSELNSLKKELQVHKNNAAEAQKQLQEKDATINGMIRVERKSSEAIGYWKKQFTLLNIKAADERNCICANYIRQINCLKKEIHVLQNVEQNQVQEVNYAKKQLIEERKKLTNSINYHNRIIRDVKFQCEKNCSALKVEALDKMNLYQKANEQLSAMKKKNCDHLTQISTLLKVKNELATELEALQCQHQNMQHKMECLIKENTELQELALMTDKQKAKKQKDQKNAEKKKRKLEKHEQNGKQSFWAKLFN